MQYHLFTKKVIDNFKNEINLGLIISAWYKEYFKQNAFVPST